jgi:hypothetical protein
MRMVACMIGKRGNVAAAYVYSVSYLSTLDLDVINFMCN